MPEQAIGSLQTQIGKMDAKDFDLTAWKRQTALLLRNIFGESDPRITQIENLEVKFNSWSLRDASGNESYEARSKRIGKEILEAAISELEVSGLPVKKNPDETATLAHAITSLLFDELKGSQVKQLKAILQAHQRSDETLRQLTEVLESLDKSSLVKIQAGLLMHDVVLKLFQE